MADVLSYEWFICPPLPSTVITGFIGIMDESDSLHTVSSALDEMLLVRKILFRGYARSPRYAVINSLVLAMLSDPGGTRLFSLYRPTVIACCRGDGIGFHFMT